MALYRYKKIAYSGKEGAEVTMKKDSGIYMMVGPTGALYIGESSDMAKRKKIHRSNILSYRALLAVKDRKIAFRVLTHMPGSTGKERIMVEKEWHQHFRQFREVVSNDVSSKRKLAEAQIRHMRALHGKKTYRQIASQFGVSYAVVNDVLNGITYKDVR